MFKMSEELLEKKLLMDFLTAKENHKAAELKVKDLKKTLDIAQAKLIEYLEDVDAKGTARYEDIGHATRMLPKIYANVTIENQDKLFEYLRSRGYEYSIKETVHSSTLSSIVKELMEKGDEIPEFITVYPKPQIKAYPKK